MKIYFAGSIRAGRYDQELYLRIISLLNSYGTVLTEHVGDAAVFEKEEGVSDTAIFEQDISWLKQADLVVAEVTSPSLGVGYEIGIAESLNKPILCIYRTTPDKQLSAMIAGNSALIVSEYQGLENLSDLKVVLDNFLSNYYVREKEPTITRSN